MTARPDIGTTHGAEPGEWLALHIFYTADTRPVLTDCVAPLVRDLRNRGLLGRYFFINYWMEGSHVRLRLKPVSAAATAEVCRTAEAAIGRFLTTRPALYEVDEESLGEFQESLLGMEYSPGERLRMFPDGRMPIQANNTFQHRPYEPEYGRYGGPAGVELAEWHFEHSSDLVLNLVETANVHVRSVNLGLAAQIMMITASTFLRSPDSMAAFFESYFEYWNTAFELAPEQRSAQFEANHDTMADLLTRRFAEVHSAVRQGDAERLTGFRADWARHCANLRDRVVELGTARHLRFERRTGSADPVTITDPETLLPRLLAPYTHMTNNRLSATLRDETYLAYTLARTLRANADTGAFDVTGAVR